MIRKSSDPYDPKKFYNGKAPSPLKTGLLVGRIGIVLKAMVADQTEEGSVIVDAGFYKAKALESVSAFDSVIVVGVSNEILHIRKYVVDVDVVSGGAGGGIAQNQVRNASNVWTDVGYYTGNESIPVNVVAGGAGGGLVQLQVKSVADAWTNVGYFTGNLTVPVEIIASIALGRTWTITETVPISNAYLVYLVSLDVDLSTRASETTLASLLTELQQKLETADLSLEAVTKYLNANVKNFPADYPDASVLAQLDVALSTRLKPADLNLDGDKDLQVDVKTLPSVTVGTLPSTPAGTNNIGDVDVASMPEDGTVLHISKTVTGDLITPASGKAIKILGFFFYSTADITVELRFKTSTYVIGGLTTKGVCGMNLISMKKPQGSADELVEVYLSGAGTVKGWVVYIEV